MPVKSFVEDVNEVEESIREFYVQDETLGGYKLDVEAVNGLVLENVDSLRSALNKERKSAKDFEKKYREVSTKFDGIDLEEYSEIKTKYEELSKLDPEKEAERLALEKYETQKKRLETQLTKQFEAKIATEYEPIKQKYTTVETQLRQQMVRGNALAAIAAEEGDVDLLLPHVEGKMKFEINDEGEFETYLADNSGEPLYNDKGEKMKTREFVASLKSKFPGAFKSTVKSGGGTQSSGKSLPSHVDPNKLSPIQMIQLGLKK